MGRASITGLLVLAGFASACERTEPEAAPRAPSTASTAAPATTSPPAATAPGRSLDRHRNFDTADLWVQGTDIGDPQGSGLLRQVRFGAGDGYDRVVFEYEDRLSRFFSVAYAGESEGGDLPSECVAPKRLPGADLVVSFGGGTSEDPYSDSSRRSYTGRTRIRPRSTEQVREAVLFCEFEGELDWVLVVGEKRPFRVSTLDGPPRLVVDVARARDAGQRALGRPPRGFTESVS